MPVYVKVTATVIVKIQDPVGENAMQELEDNTCLIADGNELVEEDYKFEAVDAD